MLLSGDELENTNIIGGANTAISELNKLNSPKFEVILKAHKNQWGQEADDAVDALFEWDARALIAPGSGIVSHLMFQVAGRTRIPSVTLCSDTSVTGATIPWCVRIAPTTVEEIRAISDFLKKSDNKRFRTIAFVPSGRSGREITSDIQKAVTNTIFRIAEVINVDFEKFPNEVELKNLLKKNTECAFIWLPHAYAIRLIDDLRSIGFKGVIVVSSKLFTSDFVSYSRKWGYEIYFSTTPLSGIFESAREFYPEELDPAKRSYTSMLTHDAVILLAKHLAECDLEHPYKNFPPNNVKGWTGELVFTKNGDRITKMQVWKIIDGKVLKAGN